MQCSQPMLSDVFTDLFWHGLAVVHRSPSMDPISSWMGDHLQVGKPSRYVASA